MVSTFKTDNSNFFLQIGDSVNVVDLSDFLPPPDEVFELVVVAVRD